MSDIALIDLSGIFHANWHASANEELSHAQGLTVAKVRQIAAKHAHVAVCCDQGRSFRKARHPEYKAQRERNEALYAELERTRERLAADGMLMWGVDTFEADDVIATAARYFAAPERGIGAPPVVIYSNDKVLTQLIGANVTQISTMTGAVMDAATVVGKFGVPPVQMRDRLALVGDSSDNIKGVKGIGAKNATVLLDKYRTIDDIYIAIDKSPQDFKPAQLSAFLDARESIKVAKWLIDLRYDVPLNFAEIFERREQKPLVEEAPLSDLPDSEIDESEPEAPPPVAPETKPTEKTPPPAVPPPPAPTQIAVYQPPGTPYERQLEPATMGQAGSLAKSLWNSRLYSRFPSHEAIAAVIIRGREMGLGALTSLDSFHVIEGKPAPHAMLIIARGKAHPDCEYLQCIETNGTTATWVTKNRNNKEPTRLTYTLEQAKLAGLPHVGAKGPNNWIKRPDEMIRKTAGVQLVRMEYPDAALGLYAIEELGGDE